VAVIDADEMLEAAIVREQLSWCDADVVQQGLLMQGQGVDRCGQFDP